MRTEEKQIEPSFWQIFSNTFWGVFRLILAVILLTTALAGGLGLGMVMGWIQTADPIREEELEIKTGLTTFIYDIHGNVIASLTGQDNINRIQIGYEQINRYLEHAIVAIEDERFYEHSGFDLIRIGSSVVSLVANRGEIRQGGSTITQQVYKNYSGRFEVTFERKIQEIYNAILMEMRFDKKQILTMYVNIVNMGNGNRGFQSASRMYFGKDVQDVNIAEAAFLAGIPNAPSRFNPYTERGLKNTIARQSLVLNKMLELGFISPEEHAEALAYDITIVPKDILLKPETYTSYFVDHVIDEVIRRIIEEKGVTEEIATMWLYNNGYHIYTTKDPEIQQKVDAVFTNPEFFPILNPNGTVINANAMKFGETPQASIVIIDQRTGAIKAMYGGSGEKIGNRTLNRATQSFRQPGSAFKPIAIYAPALEERLITAASVFDDVPVRLDPKNPEELFPTNYISLSYRGLTSVLNALKSSSNVVAARIFVELLGRDRVVEYLQRVGIDRGNVIYDDTTVSVAMGGLATGVSALEMTAAFATFANKGFYISPHSFLEVRDPRGNLVVTADTSYQIAYSEETAFIMTHIMSQVNQRGRAPDWTSGTAVGRISIQDGAIPISGKTGTTDAHLDKWFVGFTPYYTATVWYGYDNQIQPISLQRPEYNQALLIWNTVMNLIHENLEPKSFEKPMVGLVERVICVFSGQLATELCKRDPRGDASMLEFFITGTEPHFLDDCTVHSEIPQCIASRDSYGRHLLAIEGVCPLSMIIRPVGIIRPTPYIELDPSDPPVQDREFEKPVGIYCTVHGFQPLFIEPDPFP